MRSVKGNLDAPGGLELPPELVTPYGTGLTTKQLEAIGATILSGSTLDAFLDHAIWVLLKVRSNAMVHEGVVVTNPLRATSKLDLFKHLASIRIRRIEDKELASQLEAELKRVASLVSASVKTRDHLAHGCLKDSAGGVMRFKITTGRRLEIWKVTPEQLFAAPRAAILAAIEVNKFAKHFDILNQQTA